MLNKQQQQLLACQSLTTIKTLLLLQAAGGVEFNTIAELTGIRLPTVTKALASLEEWWFVHVDWQNQIAFYLHVPFSRAPAFNSLELTSSTVGTTSIKQQEIEQASTKQDSTKQQERKNSTNPIASAEYELVRKKEKKLTGKKRKKVRSFTELLNEHQHLDTDEFRKAWETWCEWRKREKRVPVTGTTAEKQIDMLAKYPVEIAIEALSLSISNSWQGLFPQKVKRPPKPPASNTSIRDGVITAPTAVGGNKWQG